MRSNIAHWHGPDKAYWGEIACLSCAAPLFYFAVHLPNWGPLIGLLLLAASWFWRKRQLGYWFMRTPADWPLLWFCLLLPMAVLVAPPDLRGQYAYPRAMTMVWNLALFSTIVVHSGREERLGQWTMAGFVAIGAIIALAGLFGTRWDTKVLFLTTQLERLPRLFEGVFAGASDGFSPNQLAGTLLYVLPLALAWLVTELRRRCWSKAIGLGVAVALMGVVMIATQSRAGIAGLAFSLAVLLLWPTYLGRWLLGLGLACILVAALLLPTGDFLTSLDNATKVQGTYGSLSIAGRMEIWSRAVEALQDFPFTGIGFGSFRGVVHQFYPLFLITPGYDIAHAHNFFLQVALDFGLSGMIAMLALYLLALVQCVALWRKDLLNHHRTWAVGLLGALLGQAVYSMADAVAMGSKTNFVFWCLLGIIFGVTSTCSTSFLERTSKTSSVPFHG